MTTNARSQQRQMPLIEGGLAALNVEAGLYILIGLLALGLRLWGLGDSLLTEAEAREALSAWRFASLSAFEPTQPVSPAWYTLTSLTFWAVGAGEFWARFWPALAGTALVFTPLVFRAELGRGSALASAALLAVSASLTAASRTADGTTLAALSLVAALAGARYAAENDFQIGAIVSGAALGLGLASGPRFLSGVAALLLALLLVVFVRPEMARTLHTYWRALLAGGWPMLTALGGAFVLAASAGLVNPSGLSAAGAAAPTWLAGWVAWPGAWPLWLIPQLLLVHEPVLWVMGLGGVYVAYLSGLWHGLAERVQVMFAARDPEMEPALAGGGASELSWRGAVTALVTAALGAILFGIVYPARQPSDSIWVVVPLAMLAGRLLVGTFGGEWFESELETVLAQAGVLFVMLLFMFLQLAAYGRGYILVVDRPIEVRLMLAGGVLALAVFVTVMFALGWSRLSAVRGAVLAVGLASLLASVSATLALNFWRVHDPNNLWVADAPAPGLRLLTEAVEDIALRTVGQEEDLEVVVVGDAAGRERDGLLGWQLRGFTKLRFAESVALAADSPVVIAAAGAGEAELAADYVGERFPVQTRQLLSPLKFETLINWSLFRAWPTETSRSLDLWVRSDVHHLIQQR